MVRARPRHFSITFVVMSETLIADVTSLLHQETGELASRGDQWSSAFKDYPVSHHRLIHLRPVPMDTKAEEITLLPMPTNRKVSLDLPSVNDSRMFIPYERSII